MECCLFVKQPVLVPHRSFDVQAQRIGSLVQVSGVYYKFDWGHNWLLKTITLVYSNTNEYMLFVFHRRVFNLNKFNLLVFITSANQECCFLRIQQNIIALLYLLYARAPQQWRSRLERSPHAKRSATGVSVTGPRRWPSLTYILWHGKCGALKKT